MITGHRPDLDGLRTVAVYLVLLFHAGLSWFGGGYVGVDMFFCLSGFLVTSVLMTELQGTGSLRVGRFYSRRVRRLLPAAVVVVIATCLTFTLVWSVVRRASIVGDAVSALLYYANFHFLSASGDYFAADIDKSPFLHFWSLSIEEQFYAVFPVLLLVLFRVGRARRRSVVLGGLGLLFVLSLAEQIWFATRNVDRAYYGTDTRLYQLLAGALLTATFAFTSRRLGRRPAHLVAVVGILGIVVVASGMVHLSPSWRGIGATVASILVLGGLAMAEASPLSRLLALKPMAYLGRISYGTYLWHWPVIVALGTWLDAGPLPVAVLAFAIATGLAALSAELMELPIRRSPRLDGFTWPVVVAGLATSALVAATIVPNVLERDQKPVVLAATSTSGSTLGGDDALARDLDRAVPDLDFRSLIAQHGPWQYCSDTDIAACRSVRGSGPTVLLVGDSQAQTFIPVFKKLAKEYDFNLDLNVLAGCPWQEGLTNDKSAADTAQECTGARVGWYDDVLPRLHPDVVVLLDRPRDDPQEWGKRTMLRDGTKLSLDQAVWETTRETLAKVSAVSPAVVIQRLTMPDTFEPADCLASAKVVGSCAVSAQPAPSPTDAFVTTLAVENHRIHALDLNPIFCPTRPVCSPIQHDQLVWRDDHHYTVSYAKAMRQQVWSALQGTGVLEQQ
jgi:peptidoglycan/LPS O-acetylase OafA/YrhL